MAWPTQQDYNEAIQNPRTCFEEIDLQTAVVECNNLGLPRARSGNFATVYKFDSGGKKWAARCFNRQTPDQQEKYTAINAHLRHVALPYTVEFAYLARGIRVGAQWYPIVKMEWAEGIPLDKWVENNLHNREALMGFLKSFVTMLSALQQASIAHGDLQHGNILVVNSVPKLVDYDGMYVPALSGRTSSELGQPNYQNPRRTAFDFGPYLDNFSGWVIALSLLALIVDPKLWQTFKGGDDCLLFRKRDFEAPNQSALVKALDSEPNQELHQLVTLFKTVIACSPQSVPAITETFSLSSLPVQKTQAAVPDWIKTHLPQTSRPTNAPQPYRSIDWLLDATNATAPLVKFENPIAALRVLAYLSLIVMMAAVRFAIHNSMPLSLVSLPSLVGINLLVWRDRYRSEPAFSQLCSVGVERSELRERIRVMDAQIQEVNSEKEKITNELSSRKAAIAKEGRELQTKEQSVVNENDAKLQSAISSLLKTRQQLDSKETADLTALQNGLGKTVSGLSQSLGALGQAENNELTNALTSMQRVFVQGALQNARISVASIPGIGYGYKARLSAAGILAAADIDYRINTVKGIGSARANALDLWRGSIEALARNRMPRALPSQDHSSIRSKYASQKTSLESQLNKHQEDLRNQQSAIRTKYAALVMPLDAAVAAERERHQADANKIVTDFTQKRGAFTSRVREAEQDAVREITKSDARQNEVRKEIFALQWRMGKVEREIGRFSQVSFISYAKHVLIFS